MVSSRLYLYPLFAYNPSPYFPQVYKRSFHSKRILYKYHYLPDLTAAFTPSPASLLHNQPLSLPLLFQPSKNSLSSVILYASWSRAPLHLTTHTHLSTPTLYRTFALQVV